MENDNTSVKLIDRIKSRLGEKPGKYDFFFVLLLYIAAIAVYSLMDNFLKRIDIYSDELLYYTIAQSIHDGNGALAMNAHTAFNKYIYSILLSPFFGIEDPILRVNMITLFNKALMLSSLLLIYFIGKEIELKRGYMLAALGVAVLWPDFTYSMGFMAENLNWPLTLLAIFLWFKAKKGKHVIAYSLGFAAVCYLGYHCKNIFLALFLSAVLYEAAYPIVTYWISRKEAPEKKLREYFDKKSLLGCGISVLLFAVCYIVVGRLLMNGDNTIIGTLTSDKSNEYGAAYTFLYLIFAFVYYLAASVIAVLAMPIARSAASFKQMDVSTRKIFSMLMIYLVISCGMIAFTISINEDVGSVLPRLHMRYLGFILLLLIVIFFKVLQTKSGEDPKFARGQLIFTLVIAFLACMLFEGSNDEMAVIDQSVMNVYNSADVVLSSFSSTFLTKKFYVIKFAAFAVIAFVTYIVYYYANRKRSEQTAAVIFFVFIMFISLRNLGIEVNEVRYAYSTNEDMVEDALTLDRYFDNAGNDKTILFINSGRTSKEHKTLTTYFDHIGQLCEVIDSDVYNFAADGKVIDVPNTDFEFNIASFIYTYDKFDGFDYIIMDHKCHTELLGVELIEEASGKYYTLYKNLERSTVETVPVVYVGEPLEKTFSEDSNDVNNYCKFGIEKSGDYAYWTNADRVGFQIPVIGEFESAKVTVKVAETFNNTPQRYIVTFMNDILVEGTLTGAGEISFTVPVSNEVLRFDIISPTAMGVENEDLEYVITGDIKRYAFKISGFTVE